MEMQWQKVNDLIHQLIIINITISTLERDSAYLEPLKMRPALQAWIEVTLKALRDDKYEITKELGKNGCRLEKEIKKEDDIWVYTYLNKGMSMELRYMTIALRNWVQEEIKKRLGIEYLTNKLD